MLAYKNGHIYSRCPKVNLLLYISKYISCNKSKEMEINDDMPSFDLLGTDDAVHSTGNYTDRQAIVIIFTCNHCPYARAYIDRIAAIVDTYENKGIGFYAISSNDVTKYPEDSFDKMKVMAGHLHLNGKYLYDESQTVAQQFGAVRTPEVFVFNKARKLVYHGAIDNNWENPNGVDSPFLTNALDFILSGVAVEIRETPTVGCSIKWKA